MKIKGIELRSFMNQAWPQPEHSWYWDHEAFDNEPEPNEVYDTDDIGPILYQGNGDDPTNGAGYTLSALIKRWRKERDFDLFAVEVPKAKAEEIKSVILSAGGKIA